MPEYIEREALLKSLSESVVFSCRTEDAPRLKRDLEKLINCIKSQPTADVAKIVRCGKCLYWNLSGYCMLIGSNVHKNYADYCSRGEKKVEEKNYENKT